jgi:acyl-CoA hydrolase
MDRAAGLAASRFGHCNFVTASLDALEFKAPVRQGEIAEVQAMVVYTSSHTCGIKTQVFAIDKLSWNRRPCCTGTLFMVAIGPEGKPVRIPQLEIGSKEAKARWEEAKAIHGRMTKEKRKPRGANS